MPAPEATPGQDPGKNPPPPVTGDPKAGKGGDPPGQDPAGQSKPNPPEVPYPGGEGDIGDLETAKKVIADLRKENAKSRTTNKDLKSKVDDLDGRYSKLENGLKGLFGNGGDKLTPEQQIEALTEKNQNLEVETALREAAWEHGIGKEEYDYFSFLVNKKLDGLGDNEQLSEETLTALAVEAKGKTANSSTSVGGEGAPKGGPNDPPPATPQDVDLPTPDEFAEMGMGQQSLLYQKLKAKGKEADYDKLWKASEQKRRELKRKKRLF